MIKNGAYTITTPLNIEKIPYPKEEVEHLVNQIIKVYCESNGHNAYYNKQIETCLTTLNDGLRLMLTPRLLIKDV
jgi:hypothetical protein